MVMSKSIPNTRLKRKLWLLPLIAVGITAGLLFSNPLQAKDSVPNLGKSLFGNYLAGRHAQFDSNPHFAIEYYRSVLKNTPNNTDLLRRIVMLLVSEGKIGEALPTAKRLLKLSKDKANSARLIVALSEIKNENYGKAIEQIDQLPEGGLNTFSVPMLKAWLLAGQTKYDEALKILDKKTSNKGLEALFGIHGALISELSGNTEDAIARYKKTANLRKSANLRITILFGNLYERLGQTENAKAIYDRYKRQRPATSMLNSAFARLKSGKKPAPNNKTARDGAAEALFSLGFAIQNQNPFQTVIFSRLAVYLRPSFTIASLLLAESLDGNERLEDANKVYLKISSDPAYAWTARLRIANNLDRLGDTEDAIRELKAMSLENNKRIDALIRMGGILQRHKRYQEASKAFEDAKSRIPEFKAQHWSLHYSLGISYERLKKWPMAEKNFLKALDLRPNHPSVLNYLGYSWVEQGLHLDRAQEMIRSAVKQRPRDGYIIDSLGWVLYRLGDMKGAVKQLERAVQMRPEDPTINDHLGDIYWAVGRKNEATFQWKRALTLEPEKDQIPKIEEKLKNGLPKDANKRKGI
jgi:tetratricopeptide (TPR) repeat protein